MPNLGGIEPVTASPVTPKKGKKRVKKNIAAGVVHIAATFNNTMITITDVVGERDLLVVGRRARLQGLAQVDAVRRPGGRRRRGRQGDGARPEDASRSRSRGPGAGRESALRALSAAGLKISLIRDVTPIPHNGCRPPKRRRV